MEDTRRRLVSPPGIEPGGPASETRQQIFCRGAGDAGGSRTLGSRAAVTAGTVCMMAASLALVFLHGVAHADGEDAESTYARKNPVGTAFREGDADDE